jgi:multiple sugar transport system permease protein
MSSSASRVADLPQAPPAHDRPTRVRRPIHRRDGFAALVLLIPALVGFIVFWILPSISGVLYSVTDFNLLNEPNFIGADNFRELAGDTVAIDSMKVTLQFAVFSVVIGTVLALVTAALMQRLRLKIWVRSILLLPWLVPNVAIALVWAWLLDGNLGYLNGLMRTIGLPGVSFYNDAHAMPIIITIGIWAGLGYTALILFAGMTQVPTEMYEAGAIDGASETRMFFSITLPLIRPVIALVVVMSAIGSFQVFDLVMIGYDGNPIPAVRVIFFYIYQQSFAFFRMGYGSTIALVLAVVLAALTVIQMRVMRANRSDLS